MLFENITYLAPDGRAVPNAYVGVRGNTIAYLAQTPPGEDFGERYDGSGKLLIPGFYNTHCHVPMTLLRGYGEGLSLQDWLFTRIFPFEERLTGEDVYWGSLLGIAEMLRTGTASFSDMYFFSDHIARAVLESGIKCNLARGITYNGDDADYLSQPARQQSIALFEQYNGAGEGRLLVEFAVHAEYTCSELCLRDYAELAAKYNTGLQLHLSETHTEHRQCKESRGGRTPARVMADCGVFDVRALAAHCVHLEEEDIALLAEKGVGVAHNPSSNLKLGSGVAPVRRMLDAGITVGLGTDGAASNNTLNMLKEAQLGLMMQCGAAQNSKELAPAEMLKMATASGAQIQGRTGCGSIAQGNRADLVVLDFDRPHIVPVHDPLAALMFSAAGSDVALNMVDGQVLYRDGRFTTIDIRRVMDEVSRRAAAIASQLA